MMRRTTVARNSSHCPQLFCANFSIANIDPQQLPPPENDARGV